MTDAHDEQSAQISTTEPHSARIWNYWLGGKDHYEVDRVAGEQFREAFPGIVDNARAFRHFLARAIRHLAGEAGIDQFLDVGTGLPTVDNTHQVAQRVNPAARIVYVDNDPLVLLHAHALLTSHPDGVTDYLDADLRAPATILQRARRTLDFERPVALILSGILGHVADYEEARAIVADLLNALPSGSYLLVCDGTATNAELLEAQQAHNEDNEGGGVVYHLRTPEQMAGYFEGLELVEPGVVPCPDWRREVAPLTDAAPVDAYGGVGRKP
ncbi:SAM-dependent methyltransferase [Streptomyces iconiensis]|uniref:SAM-dependent methyltransferase n=1 Tax=Streptomyces iconiensis TaxID=1384038 RepID=A0ABT6ZZ07_9ACTN|nr:SAM-dependent methyltransferase [Streptomyces iconiensis]MDJ1134305.1 SAM-dependent methyltransferase [Streptomyces iconiensis]